ncbi:GNAT family N-acetyltransferase [Cellulophaga sp. Hel_I_12]|uniref:GNAT family N-acetyltransferase n=1 Tax=Cellulophaga sp. Hel_I_12 TaxID=1249972 RepID=UPI000648F276|nr:GNAT family N-acetyltransferase [Cellulophaga sp. Hel_I_12]
MIRAAKISEITDILTITKACAKKMANAGIYQWNEQYPSKIVFEKDIERKELFVFEKSSKIIGVIVISTFMDEEYKAIKWLSSQGKAIYIHRLAIHPDFQSQGYAQQLMNFAENYARENSFTSVRLDTFSENIKNQQFYNHRGYQKLEAIYFPRQSDSPFYCYELLV